MVCNKYIKLGLLIDLLVLKEQILWQLDIILKWRMELSMGDDAGKDQVYFLSQNEKDNLKYLKFPIEILKTKS